MIDSRALGGSKPVCRKKLLLYVHIPFCESKCHFCFKVSDNPRSQLLDASLHDNYVEALTRSIRHHVSRLHPAYEPTGINWGGGTPTILPPKHLRAIADAFRPEWDLSDNYFSVETTPDSLTEERLDALCSVGVNRLSIGVQSFDDTTLRRSGRCHTGADVSAAVERARRFGIHNINLDLILTLPYETIAEALGSLQAAINLATPHITTYFYNPTPNTILLRQLNAGHVKYWNRDDHLEAHERASAMLTQAGYSNYEFFHWSRDPSRWAFVSLDDYFGHANDVFGFGAGAQSFMEGHGCLQTRELNQFLRDPYWQGDGKYDLEYALERALGSRWGINFSSLARTFGLDRESVARHPLVDEFRHVPNIKIQEDGLSLDPSTYMREYVDGLSTRFNSLVALKTAGPEKSNKIA